jgi:hypothetical protein
MEGETTFNVVRTGQACLKSQSVVKVNTIDSILPVAVTSATTLPFLSSMVDKLYGNKRGGEDHQSGEANNKL